MGQGGRPLFPEHIASFIEPPPPTPKVKFAAERNPDKTPSPKRGLRRFPDEFLLTIREQPRDEGATSPPDVAATLTLSYWGRLIDNAARVYNLANEGGKQAAEMAGGCKTILHG